jgi:hypothetical protein
MQTVRVDQDGQWLRSWVASSRHYDNREGRIFYGKQPGWEAKLDEAEYARGSLLEIGGSVTDIFSQHMNQQLLETFERLDLEAAWKQWQLNERRRQTEDRLGRSGVVSEPTPQPTLSGTTTYLEFTTACLKQGISTGELDRVLEEFDTEREQNGKIAYNQILDQLAVKLNWNHALATLQSQACIVLLMEGVSREQKRDATAMLEAFDVPADWPPILVARSEGGIASAMREFFGAGPPGSTAQCFLSVFNQGYFHTNHISDQLNLYGEMSIDSLNGIRAFVGRFLRDRLNLNFKKGDKVFVRDGQEPWLFGTVEIGGTQNRAKVITARYGKAYTFDQVCRLPRIEISMGRDSD